MKQVQQSSDLPTGHLVLKDVFKRYQSFQAVGDLNLAVDRGKLVSLLGPSGCGKSTTLRMIAGLIPITSGAIFVGGKDLSYVPAHQRDMGLVFQSYALFPHMSINQNVAYGLHVRGVRGADAATRVRAALEMVGLGALGERKPRELSGGQQQRVALARALVIEPSILLLDEPLSNLDAILRERMRDEIRDIQQRLGITTVFVTHDQSEALAMSDVVAVMKGGFLEQVGSPVEIYERPESSFVAGFVGRTNRLVADVEKGIFRLGEHAVRGRTVVSGRQEIHFRPHRVQLHDGSTFVAADGKVNTISGIVERVTYVGEVIHTEIRVGGELIAAETPTMRISEVHPIGSRVSASWLIDDTLMFKSQ